MRSKNYLYITIHLYHKENGLLSLRLGAQAPYFRILFM